MKYTNLIENVSQLEEKILETEHIYFESIEKLREIREDLSKLDIDRHLVGVVKTFLIKWGTMARVVGQEGLDWEGYGHKIQELEPEFGELRDKPFLSIDFYDENISNAIEAIYKKLRQFPKLRGPTVISKVLHLLNPEIFVMWDANIRKVYHKKNRLVNDTDKGYLEFLKESQNEIKEAISDFQRESGKTIDEVEQEIRSKFDNKTLARIVDEYNYITYTLSPNEANKVSKLKIVTESMSATHMIPDPNKPLTEYICNPKHFIYATKCMILLKSFPRLNVQKVACHGRKPHTYTCWYVFFENKKILNFTIKKSNVDVEFRQLQHTPDLIGVWHWVNPNKMKGIYYNDYPERELKKILSAYLKNIKVDLKEK